MLLAASVRRRRAHAASTGYGKTESRLSHVAGQMPATQPLGDVRAMTTLRLPQNTRLAATRATRPVPTAARASAARPGAGGVRPSGLRPLLKHGLTPARLPGGRQR